MSTSKRTHAAASLRWKPRRWLYAAAALGAILAILVHLPPVQRAVVAWGLESLGEAVGCDISVGEISANLLTGRMSARRVELTTATAATEASRITVGSVELALSLPALLRRRIVVPSVEVADVAVRLGRDAEGRIVVPRPTGSSTTPRGASWRSELPDVSVRNIELSSLSLAVGADGSGRRVAVERLRAHASLELAELTSRGTMEVGALRLDGSGAGIVEQAHVSWRLDRGDGAVRIRLTGPLELEGRVELSALLGAPAVAGEARADVPLELLGPLVAPELGLSGRLEARLRTAADRSIELELQAERFAAAGLRSPLVTANGSYRNGRLSLSRLTMELAGGRIEARGGMRLEPSLSDITVAATVTGMDLGAVLEPLRSGIDVAGTVDGTVELQAATPDLEAVAGAVQLRVEQRKQHTGTTAALRPRGRLQASLAGGVLNLQSLELQDGATEVVARGRVGLVRREWGGSVKAEVPDLAPYLALAGLEGSGALRCDLRGEARAGSVAAEGDAEVDGLRFAELTVDRALLGLRLRDRRLEVGARDLSAMGVSSNGASAIVDIAPRAVSAFTFDASAVELRGAPWPDIHARGELGPTVRVEASTGDAQASIELRRAATGELSIDAGLRAFDLSRLAPLLPAGAADIAGAVSGGGKLVFDASGAMQRADLALDAVTARSRGHQLDLAQPASVHLSDGVLRFERLGLVVDRASGLDVMGTVALDGRHVDLDVQARDLDLSAWADVVETPLGGRCTAKVEVRGTRDAPRLAGELGVDGLRIGALTAAAARGHFDEGGGGGHSATVSFDGLAWEGHPLGDGSMRASLGTNLVRVHGQLLGGQLRVDATGELVAPRRFAADATCDHVELAGIGGVFGLPTAVQGTVSGTLHLEESIDAPRGATIRARLPEVALSVGGVPLEGRIEATLADGLLEVRSAELDGRALFVRARGSLPLEKPTSARAGEGLEIETRGDMGIVLALLPWLDRAEGAFAGHIVVAGSLAEPVATGEVSITEGAVDGPAFPAPLDRVSSRLLLSRDALRLESLSARLGGGTVEASGTVALRGDPPGALEGSLRLREVVLTPDPLLDLTGEADLKLGGRLVAPQVSGELRITQLTYTPRTDALAALRDAAESALKLKPAAQAPADGTTGAGTAVRFDVLVLAPGSVEVVGHAVNVDLSARIQVAGSTRKPSVTGGITVDEGDITLFGSDFEVTRGSLDFLDPDAVDPELDISAQTNKAGETITVAITGRASKPYLQLGSASGRSQEEIMRLLLGRGSESDGVLSTEALVSAAARGAAQALANQIGLVGDLEIIPFPTTPEGDKLLFVVGKDLGGGFVVRYGVAVESGDSDVVEVVAEVGAKGMFRLRQNTDSTLSGGFRLRGKIR